MNFKLGLLICFSLVIIQLTIVTKAKAQFSINGSITQLTAENTNDQFNQFQFEAGYWTRLKKYRLEFYPSLFYNSYEANAFDQDDSESLGFALPINVYPYDFRNDCDCPNHSKSGVWLKKSFYIQLKPAVEYELMQERIALSTGLYLGLDFGISDFLTISPAAGYQHYIIDESTWKREGGLSGQLRLIFRPDYTKGRR